MEEAKRSADVLRTEREVRPYARINHKPKPRSRVKRPEYVLSDNGCTVNPNPNFKPESDLNHKPNKPTSETTLTLTPTLILTLAPASPQLLPPCDDHPHDEALKAEHAKLAEATQIGVRVRVRVRFRELC